MWQAASLDTLRLLLMHSSDGVDTGPSEALQITYHAFISTSDTNFYM
jgi:hypothetical protein